MSDDFLAFVIVGAAIVLVGLYFVLWLIVRADSD